MGAKVSSPLTVFEKVLRAFETGGFTFTEVRIQLRRLLATGASPTDLMEILRRRELFEPLPEHAHEELLGILNEAIGRDATRKANAPASKPDATSLFRSPAGDETAPNEEARVDLESPEPVEEEPIPRKGGAGRRMVLEPGSPLLSTPSVLPELVRSLEERIGRQEADYEARTQAYERAKEAESAALARAAALAADLAAARAALESEQSRIREIDKARLERAAAAEAARSRGEEALRESERYQTELRTLRDSLAARDATIANVLRSLGERDAQLAAVQTEFAKTVPALEARMKTGVQLETDLQATRARATALAAQLASAQSVLETEQARARQADKALAERAASFEAARSRGEGAQRESERYQTESRTLRDSLAARDATIAKVLRSLGERDAQLAALQQEHGKMVPAFEARTKSGVQLEADLAAARTRIDAMTAELKVKQETVASLNAQLRQGQSHLHAARAELDALKTESKASLEVLRTREWRRGFDQNIFRELDARVDAADMGSGELQAERDRLRAQVASLQSKLEAREALQNPVRAAASSDAPQPGLKAAQPAQPSPPSPPPPPQRVAQFVELESAKVTQAARSARWEPDAETVEQATPVPEDPDAASDVLMDRYQLLALIDENAVSRVYKARDLGAAIPASPDSFVAVKVLNEPLDDEKSLAAFSEDVQKLKSLVHPNIARIFDAGVDGSTVFLVMEYVAGPSLDARLHGTSAPRSGLDRDEAQSIILGLANALDYAHRNDVVHGDLKPGNVFAIDQGKIKITGFDIADGSAQAHEHREAQYTSPQLMAAQIPEPVDDVYALACLAYEILTGAQPFDTGAGVPPVKVSPRRRAGLSSPQYLALMHALQPERRNRTPTVRQFVAEFSAPAPARAWKPNKTALVIGSCAAALLLAVVYFFAHRAPVPTPAPAHPIAALPTPGTVLHDCPACPLMTVLPAGRFKQGSALADSGAAPFEKPLHWVAIGRPFAMSTNAVTVDEFQAFVAATGRDMQGCDIYDGDWKHHPENSWTNPGFAQTGTHPVTCASWNDAMAYAQWLSTKAGHRYRLPSASEWEYAARAGAEAAQPWNPDGSGACANANVADSSAVRRYPGWTAFGCDDGFVYTAPVGSFKANAFGLNDMLGNVFQWTLDCWHTDYSGAPVDGSARTDGDCTDHELRGGSWFSTPAYVRANYRNHFAADYRTSSVGIRLVRDLAP